MSVTCSRGRLMVVIHWWTPLLNSLLPGSKNEQKTRWHTLLNWSDPCRRDAKQWYKLGVAILPTDWKPVIHDCSEPSYWIIYLWYLTLNIDFQNIWQPSFSFVSTWIQTYVMVIILFTFCCFCYWHYQICYLWKEFVLLRTVPSKHCPIMTYYYLLSI